jgi:hypothetical protein
MSGLIPTVAEHPEISSYSCLDLLRARNQLSFFFYISSLGYDITIMAADQFLETSMTLVDF